MVERIGFTLFLIAGGLAVAGNYFNLPWLTDTGIIVFGLIAIFRGAQFIAKGEAIEGRTNISNPNYIQRYTGVSAYIIGGILILIGLLVIGGGLLGFTTPGGVTVALGNLIRTDFGIALLLSLAGLFTFTFGLVRTLSGSATTPGTHNQLVEAGIRFGGVVMILVGLLLLAAAAGFLLIPDMLRGLFAGVLS